MQPQPLSQNVITDLSRAFSTPDRFFTSLDLTACLRELDDAIRHGVPISNPEAVRFALSRRQPSTKPSVSATEIRSRKR